MFSGKKPDCVKCGFVIVIPENFEVMEIIDTYQSCFTDGMGAINPQGITNVLEWESIKPSTAFIQKIIIYILASNKKSSEVANDGPENNARIRSKR